MKKIHPGYTEIETVITVAMKKKKTVTDTEDFQERKKGDEIDDANGRMISMRGVLIVNAEIDIAEILIHAHARTNIVLKAATILT
jgi:hypothetical protein